MKTADALRKFPLRDLIPYGLYRVRCCLDQIWSTMVFRLKCVYHGIEAGDGAQVWGRILFQRFPGSRIEIGRNVRIVSRPFRYALNTFPQSKVRTFLPSAKVLIGDNVSFNSACITARSRTIRIGDNTLMGGNCFVMDSDWHPVWPPDDRTAYQGDNLDQDVEIGRNVFIGLNVIILKGASIGENSVIGAGSVVTGVIPANSLAAGIPAKVIRKLG
jgi:acetyltransferase-like isoleucine patch superfamily enzyme